MTLPLAIMTALALILLQQQPRAVFSLSAPSTFGHLSAPRRQLSAVTVGNLTLFAGGYGITPQTALGSDVVDIYDATTHTWTAAPALSIGRGVMAGAAAWPYACFAGGQLGNGTKVSNVDIFDARTRTWRHERLSLARSMLAATAVSPTAELRTDDGDKYGDGDGRRDGSSYSPVFLFGGGELRESEGNTSTADDTNRVDIWDSGRNTWTQANLSQPRKKLAATTAGNFAVFGGGYLSHAGPQDAVDIFDVRTSKWSQSRLSMPRMRLQAVTSGTTDKMAALFMGGMGDVCATCPTVDAWYPQTQTWSTYNLTRGRYEFAVASLGDRVLVTGGKQGPPIPWNTTEVWDGVEGRLLSLSTQLAPRSYLAAAPVPALGVVLVAGGDLENGSRTDLVESYQLMPKE